MRFATAQGFHTAEQFYQYLKDAFDVLYVEVRRPPNDVCRLALPSDRQASRFRQFNNFSTMCWLTTGSGSASN